MFAGREKPAGGVRADNGIGVVERVVIWFPFNNIEPLGSQNTGIAVSLVIGQLYAFRTDEVPEGRGWARCRARRAEVRPRAYLRICYPAYPLNKTNVEIRFGGE